MPSEYDGSKDCFQKLFSGVLDHYGIQHETEKKLPSSETSGRGRRIDVYVPETDTAIELKTSTGNLETGVGQALNYTRTCEEAILALYGDARDAYRPDIRKTCGVAPAVHFAMVIPNPDPGRPGQAGFEVKTDSRPDLFLQMQYNTELDDDMIAVEQLIPGYRD